MLYIKQSGALDGNNCQVGGRLTFFTSQTNPRRRAPRARPSGLFRISVNLVSKDTFYGNRRTASRGVSISPLRLRRAPGDSRRSMSPYHSASTFFSPRKDGHFRPVALLVNMYPESIRALTLTGSAVLLGTLCHCPSASTVVQWPFLLGLGVCLLFIL